MPPLKFKIVPLAILITLFPLMASAESISHKLTLREALMLAGQHNRQLEAAIMDVVRNEKTLQQANASYFPTVDLSGNSGYAGRTSLAGTLQLAYSLDTSGERGAQWGMASEALNSAKLEAGKVSQQIRLDVTNAYYDLQNADQQLRIARLAKDQAEALLSEAKVMRQAGQGSDFEIQRAELQVMQARKGESDALGAQKVMRRALARIIGLEQGMRFESPLRIPQDRLNPNGSHNSLSGSDLEASDAVEKAGDWLIPLDECISMALKGSPELAQLRAQKQIAQHKRRLAFGGSLPRIQLFATANESGLMQTSPLSIDTTTAGLGANYLVGARATMNLFNGGSNRALVEQAETEGMIADTRIKDTEQAIQLGVEQGYIALQTSKQDIQLTEELLAKAKQSLDSARIRLKSGVGSQTDVIMVQGDLIQAEVSRNKAILDYNRAIATLERYSKNLALPTGEGR